MRCSSSLTTRTQATRRAAQIWDASDTVIDSGTVSAADGRSDETVPLAGAFFCVGRLAVGRLRARSFSIFLRIA